MMMSDESYIKLNGIINGNNKMYNGSYNNFNNITSSDFTSTIEDDYELPENPPKIMYEFNCDDYLKKKKLNSFISTK